MEILETDLKGCFILQPKLFKDDRGYFFECFNQKVFEEHIDTKIKFVQDNQSLSKFGTIRGLHFQKGESAQAKLVRVLRGSVLDVAVDLRRESMTYGKWIGVELTCENHKQLFVPRGFAHGFSVLSETAVFTYKCDNYYQVSSEGGYKYDDPTLKIDWKIPTDQVNVSSKDSNLPYFP